MFLFGKELDLHRCIFLNPRRLFGETQRCREATELVDQANIFGIFTRPNPALCHGVHLFLGETPSLGNFLRKVCVHMIEPGRDPVPLLRRIIERA